MSRFDILKKLGLNKAAITCYEALIEKGPADTRKLAHRLKLPQTNLYKTLNWLVEQGFVEKFKMTTQPALFIARPLDEALPEHYTYQRRLVLDLCRELDILPPPALQLPRKKHGPVA